MMADNNLSINDFMKNTVRNLTICLKNSLDLPVKGNSEDNIFLEFPQYKKVLNGLSLKIINTIQHLIDKQDGKGNLLDSTGKKSFDDKFNILVEVNDRLLDKCNSVINAIENPDIKKKSDIVIVEYQSKDQKPANESKMTPKQTIKLLSSVQIERPQLKFSKLPDNSKTPFRPILTMKPNAVEPLSKSLMNDENSEHYSHPYQTELDSFVIPGDQLTSKPQLEFPKPLEQTEYRYVDTVDQLQSLVNHLKLEREISVDLEHHSVRTYLGLTCLIQISTRSADFIIDSLVLHDNLELLNEVFTDPKILKVFHGSNSDLMWLQRDFGVYVVNMFDTGHACQALNFPRKSLSYLLEKYCKIQANKEYQRLTDWRIRPLIAELVDYARTDTHYLLYIYDKLHQELSNRNLLSDVYDSSHKLCYKLYFKPQCDLDECMELYRKSSENFNDRQLYALKRLWELRDNIAREEDESSAFVLPNRILLAIAQGLPRETSGVLACCSQDWKLPLLRKYVYDFQKICLDAYNESLAKPKPVTKPVVIKGTEENFIRKYGEISAHSDQNEQTEINVPFHEVEKRMKVVSESPFRTFKMKSLPMDIKIIRAYLQHHTIEKTEEIVNGGNLETSTVEPEVEMEDGEENQDENDNCDDVEIVHFDESNQNISVERVETESEAMVDANKSGKRKINDLDLSKEAKKARTTIPFDYEASLQQLKQAKSNNKHTGKQFQPFKTKKFKKNNNNNKQKMN